MTDRMPVFSIILPVFNETDTISGVIAHIQKMDAERSAEIIVVDGDPDKTTIAAIKDAGVRTLVAEKGRARQMNSGAGLASGDILLFLHADTFLPSNAFALIRSAMNDNRFVGGAFELGFNTTRTIFKITELYVSLRTRLTRIPFGDQAIFIRHDFFKKIGGYRDIPIMEDVELMKRIRKQGHRVCIIPEKVRTSPRRYEQEGIVYTTIRNWMLQLRYALGVSPERLVKWYKS